MSVRLIEEIILKVGLDEASLNASLSRISKEVLGLQKDIKSLTESTKGLDTTLDKTGDQAKVSAKQFDKLEDEVSPLDKGFDKLTKSLRRYNKEAKKTAKSSGGMSQGLKNVGVAAVGLVGLNVVTDRLNELTEASLDAKKLGVATQELINLQSVGKLFGATAEDVTQGIKNINESASEAGKEGKGGKFDMFKELNIDLKEFNKLSPDQQLESFSKSIKGVEVQGRRTAIQLALMGEEGFKLSNTFDALAENSDALKAKVERLTGSMSAARIAKLNDKLADTKLRLDGVLNSFLDFSTDVFFGVEKHVAALIFDMHGLFKLEEDWNDAMRDQQEIGRRLLKERKEAQELRKKADKKAIEDQKEHTKIVKDAMAEIEAREKKRNETLSESEKKFLEKERARIADAEAKIAKMEKSKKDAADKEVKDEERKKESAIKTIEGIALSRKKDLLKKLQENAQSSGAGIIEGGSVAEAELNASLQNRDAGQLDRIKNLKNEISAEELAREDKKISIAEKILKKIEPSHPLVINRRGL